MRFDYDILSLLVNDKKSIHRVIKHHYRQTMNEQESTSQMNEGYELAFIKHVSDRVERCGLSQRQFAKAVFGPDNGPRIWQRVRNPRPEEKRRNLTLEECAKIASFFDEDLSDLILRIYKERRLKTYLK